jgi:hypothetical protein
MKLQVTLNNSVGPVDSRIVSDSSEAVAAAIDLIASAHVLYHGDMLTVHEIDE